MASRVTMMFPSCRSQNRRRYSSWLPGTRVTVVPARALLRTVRITSLWSCAQCGERRSRQKSMMSPTRYRYSQSCPSRNSSRASARQPRVPRCVSLIQMVRKRALITPGPSSTGIASREINCVSESVRRGHEECAPRLLRTRVVSAADVAIGGMEKGRVALLAGLCSRMLPPGTDQSSAQAIGRSGRLEAKEFADRCLTARPARIAGRQHELGKRTSRDELVEQLLIGAEDGDGPVHPVKVAGGCVGAVRDHGNRVVPPCRSALLRDRAQRVLGIPGIEIDEGGIETGHRGLHAQLVTSQRDGIGIHLQQDAKAVLERVAVEDGDAP